MDPMLIQALIDAGADINSLGFGQNMSALLATVAAGEIDTARCLINSGADVNVLNAQSGTALSLAAWAGKTKMVSLLMRRGADLNLAYINGCTPLMYAAEWGHREIVEMLITAHADVLHIDKYEQTAASYAAKEGQLNILEILLDAGADPTQAFSRNLSKDMRVLQLLLDRGANIDDFSEKYGTPLIRASASFPEETVKFLLDHGADPNLSAPGKFTALHQAVQYRRVSLIPLLLQYGAKIDTIVNGCTALHIAIGHSDLGCVRELLKAGGNPDLPHRGAASELARDIQCSDILALLKSCGAYDRITEEEKALDKIEDAACKCKRATLRKLFESESLGKAAEGYAINFALLCAAGRGHLGIVRDLIGRAPDTNCYADARIPDGTIYNRITPLWLAVLRGHYHLIDILIKAGANINALSGEGKALLHKVAGEGRIYLVRQLVRLGADVDLRGTMGETPLMYAVAWEHHEVVEEFLNKGADPRWADHNNRTALMDAAHIGHIDIGEALIIGGANLDTQDSHGLTALMYAARQGHLDFVELLLNEGALTDIRNSKKQTALDLARSAGHQHVVRLMSQAA
jgi:ankyrin repeat protein